MRIAWCSPRRPPPCLLQGPFICARASHDVASLEINKTLGKKRQHHLPFVRCGVFYCSAVTRFASRLPPPSLGVSSLDLGRLQPRAALFLWFFKDSRKAVWFPTDRFPRLSCSALEFFGL